MVRKKSLSRIGETSVRRTCNGAAANVTQKAFSVFDFDEEDSPHKTFGAAAPVKTLAGEKKRINCLSESKKRCSSRRKHRSVASLTANPCTEVKRDLEILPNHPDGGYLSSESAQVQVSVNGSSEIQDSCQETPENQSCLNNSEISKVGSNKNNLVDLTGDIEVGVIRDGPSHFSAPLDYQPADGSVNFDGVKTLVSILKDGDETKALESILKGTSVCNGCGHSIGFNLDRRMWLEQKLQVATLSDQYRLSCEPFCKQEHLQKKMEPRGNGDAGNEQCSGNHTGANNNFLVWRDIVYPKEDPDPVTITETDFLLLNPMEFLSDTIVDFYIKHLQTTLLEEHQQRFYFYNSFFFRKLTEREYGSSCGVERRKAAFDGVKRWTSKTNIFEKDYLFVPVMQSAHWSLVVICYPNEVLAGRQHNRSSKECCILHLDSLEGCHTGLEEPFKDYLVEAWIQKFGGQSENLDNACKRLSEIKFIHAKVPQQTNYSDCGLFLLHYVELFIQQAKDIPDCLTNGWFDPAEASAKRATIRELMIKLLTGDISGPKMESCIQLDMYIHKMDESMLMSNNDVAYGEQGCSLGILSNYIAHSCHTCGTSCPQCGHVTNHGLPFMTGQTPITNLNCLEPEIRVWNEAFHGMRVPAACFENSVLPFTCAAKGLHRPTHQLCVFEESDLLSNSDASTCLENSLEHQSYVVPSRGRFMNVPNSLETGKRSGHHVSLLESMDSMRFTSLRQHTVSVTDHDTNIYAARLTDEQATDSSTLFPFRSLGCMCSCVANLNKPVIQDQLEISIEENVHAQETITSSTSPAAKQSRLDCKELKDIMLGSLQHKDEGTAISVPIRMEGHPNVWSSDEIDKIVAKKDYSCSLLSDIEASGDLLQETNNRNSSPVKQSTMEYEEVGNVMKREAQENELSSEELDDAVYGNGESAYCISSDEEGHGNFKKIQNSFDMEELLLVSSNRRKCSEILAEQEVSGSPLTRSADTRQEKNNVRSNISAYNRKRGEFASSFC